MAFYQKDHFHSVFNDSCISPPHNPTTRRALNQFERDYIYRSNQETQEERSDQLSYLNIRGSSSTINTSTSGTHSLDIKRDYPQSSSLKGPTDIFDREMQSCDSLLAEVTNLREEHKQTMNILEELFENQKKLKETTLSLMNHCSRHCPQHPVNHHTSTQLTNVTEQINSASLHHYKNDERIRDIESEIEENDHLYTTDESDTDDTSMSTKSESDTYESLVSNVSLTENKSKVTYKSINSPDNISLCSNSDMDAFASPGIEAIEHMWDNFSIDDYAPSSTWQSKPRQTTLGNKPWSPCITIPRPFSMTIRDENKKKKKSKTILAAEREKLEREALEEVELCKSFRANPVPASTYLPLYEMINAHNENRRQHFKANSQKMLHKMEKPFTFIARENEKKKAKEEMKRTNEIEKQLEAGKQFKAKPVPPNVFDPAVNERIKEEEEYRKIRIRMRALELLANSHLPRNMQVKGSEYTVGNLRKERREKMDKSAFLTKHHSFHPFVNNEIPDHRQAYDEFQKQLMQRKEQVSTTTVAQPFDLRIDHRLSERKAKVEFTTGSSPKISTAPKRSHISFKSSLSSGHSAPMTRSVQLKQQTTLDKLACEEEKKEFEEVIRKAREEKQRELQREVSHKSVVNDLSFWMDTKQKENLQKLWKVDREKKMKYQQQLDEIQERLTQRPLLFQRVSQEFMKQPGHSKEKQIVLEQ